MLTQSNRRQSKFHPAVMVGIVGVALVAIGFAAALEVSATASARGITTISAPRTSDSVNRAAKGDRLRVIVRPEGGESLKSRTPMESAPRLTDGCESALGPIVRSPAAALIQRCVT
jgi:hypothetical protein